jgi:chemotaxis response regulator CheB
VALALEEQPDVVVMNVQMPELDGIEQPGGSPPSRRPWASSS